MTSSSPPSTIDEETIDIPLTRTRHSLDAPAQLKEELRQSIIAKRHARGEKQLFIEYKVPQQMELTSAEKEKKERRREQNRRAAQRCRNKKRMNQKNVIQSYEKERAKNLELERQIEVLKQELSDLRNSCSIHSKCCPSFASIKPESNGEIKTEPLTDDDMSMEDYRFQDYIDHKDYGSVSQYSTTPSSTKVFPYGSRPSPNSTETVPASSNKELGHIDVFPTLNNFRTQQAIYPPSDFTSPHIWQYSPTNFPVQNQSSTDCIIKGSKAQIAHLPTSDERHHHKQLSHQQYQQPQQPHIEQTDHSKTIQEPEIRLQYRPLAQSQLVSIPSIPNLCTYNHQEEVQIFQSETSPSQVVPSLRSPRPSSAISAISVSCDLTRPDSVNHMNIISCDLTRHRSLSGGSFSAYDPGRSCGDDKRLSSVSSEGSLYVDTPGSMYQDMRIMEVPDLDTDDVFISTGGTEGATLDGHDSNNNLEAVPDNNTDTDILQLLYDAEILASNQQMPATSTSADAHRSDAARMGDHISVGQLEDVSSFIQSEDFRFLSATEEQQALDVFSQFLSDSNRLDC